MITEDNTPLFDKYIVIRMDGDPYDKHINCRYFVLDVYHDEDAREALRYYADLISQTRPNLSTDLRSLLDEFSS